VYLKKYLWKVNYDNQADHPTAKRSLLQLLPMQPKGRNTVTPVVPVVY
jgi:hypothetical protein